MKKVVLITGGASGLGKSVSEAFSSEGYDVIITYNNSEEAAEKLKEKLEKQFSNKVLVIKCDLSKENDIKDTFDVIFSLFERVDVLVNNAAVEINKEFDKKIKSDFMYMLEVNVVGTFLIRRLIGDKMFAQKSGRIINISSNNAIDRFDPITLEYDVSKSAIISLTHNLAKQYSPFVNVNAIAPGWIKTDRIIKENDYLDGKLIEDESKKNLLNRFAEEEDICNLILFLASDKSSYINSEVIKIDGGVLND